MLVKAVRVFLESMRRLNQALKVLLEAVRMPV